MRKVLEYILKAISVIAIITLLYEIFDKEMNVFNWYMGALFEWLLINYVSGGNV